jgi:hypothetical protein
VFIADSETREPRWSWQPFGPDPLIVAIVLFWGVAVPFWAIVDAANRPAVASPAPTVRTDVDADSQLLSMTIALLHRTLTLTGVFRGSPARGRLESLQICGSAPNGQCPVHRVKERFAGPPTPTANVTL